MRLRVVPALAFVATLLLGMAYVYALPDLARYSVLGLVSLTIVATERAQYQLVQWRLEERRLKKRYIALSLAPIAGAVIWLAAFQVALREMGLSSAMDFTRIGIPVFVGVAAVLYLLRARLIASIQKSA